MLRSAACRTICSWGAKKFAAECREQHAGSVRSPDKDLTGNRESASKKESKNHRIFSETTKTGRLAFVTMNPKMGLLFSVR